LLVDDFYDIATQQEIDDPVDLARNNEVKRILIRRDSAVQKKDALENLLKYHENYQNAEIRNKYCDSVTYGSVQAMFLNEKFISKDINILVKETGICKQLERDEDLDSQLDGLEKYYDRELSYYLDNESIRNQKTIKDFERFKDEVLTFPYGKKDTSAITNDADFCWINNDPIVVYARAEIESYYKLFYEGNESRVTLPSILSGKDKKIKDTKAFNRFEELMDSLGSIFDDKIKSLKTHNYNIEVRKNYYEDVIGSIKKARYERIDEKNCGLFQFKALKNHTNDLVYSLGDTKTYADSIRSLFFSKGSDYSPEIKQRLEEALKLANKTKFQLRESRRYVDSIRQIQRLAYDIQISNRE
ncbi:MAG: hypothetical protein AAFO69_20010, partial [Bacteroidota bacterium]